MDTETIVRQSSAYGVLVRFGLFANKLQGTYLRANDPWTCDFQMMTPLDPELAKHAARTFLVDSYEADNIQFLQRPSHKPSQFYASFTRRDLK